MTKEEKPEYRNISLRADLVGEIEKVIKNKRYRSIAEFVAEAARLRLEELEKNAK
jgi:metal-responsive CopG/Arc/MetJ family transcriptional regulator